MASLGPLATALRISRVSTPELTNVATAVTSLVAVPLLEVVLLVAVSASLGGDDLVIVAYAAVLVAFGLTVVTGTVGQVTRDRHSGVLQDALTYRFFYAPYWLSKVTIPVALGLAVAAASCTAVFAVDNEHDAERLVSAVVMLPVVAAFSSLTAIGLASLSVGFQDPFLISNISQGVLPITAGVVAPLSTYPDLLAIVARSLPLTNAVEAMRAFALHQTWAEVVVFILREGIVSVAWLAVGAISSRLVIRALRDGRRREEIW